MYRIARLFVVLVVLPFTVGGIGRQTSDVQPAADLVRRELQAGTYEQAVKDARTLIAQTTRRFDPDSLEIARLSDLLVEALVKNGESAAQSTFEAAERAVAIKRARAGPEHLETAASMRN